MKNDMKRWQSLKKIADSERTGRNLEEVGEVGIVTATLRLKIGEVLEVRGYHQHVVHHFWASISSKLALSSSHSLYQVTRRDWMIPEPWIFESRCQKCSKTWERGVTWIYRPWSHFLFLGKENIYIYIYSNIF